MSTFDGVVAEFPNIRIDHFRVQPSSPPAFAFFLSHMHSDHLTGLESCRTFVYCSPATREIVLRLEKRFARMNYVNGLLEVRRQDYARLATLLKPLPCETPVDIELAPGINIRVTLFDANHCVGAVMFLIEGDGKSILYTGDIRSEQWWVDALVRSPILLPYVTTPRRKALRSIDSIYLDTTFASKSDPYRTFPSKAEGITELLHKISAYPSNTLFYFDSWTFGYEDVWQTLSSFLNTKVHLDPYKYGLYAALANSKEPRAPETFRLVLVHCGNHPQEGCLTGSADRARIHSCEQGTGCDILDQDFVRITPIISRHQGQDMIEPGAGGGLGDTDRFRYKLEIADKRIINALHARCKVRLGSDPTTQKDIAQLLQSAVTDESGALTIEGIDNGYRDLENLDLDDIVLLLASRVRRSLQINRFEQAQQEKTTRQGLPARIRFPYSRHSSYAELCLLVGAFKPKNIVPCTVDERGWSRARSMSALFGHLYDEPLICTHDQLMLQKVQTSQTAVDEADAIHDEEDLRAWDHYELTTNTNRALQAQNKDRDSSHTSQDRANKRAKHHNALSEDVADTHTSVIGEVDTSSRSLAGSADHEPCGNSSSIGEDALSLGPVQAELLLRQEVYNSLAEDASNWSSLNLVSTIDHEESQKEL